MLKFIKGDAVKHIDPQSSLIPLLRHEGWVVEGETAAAEDAPRRGRPPKEKEAIE